MNILGKFGNTEEQNTFGYEGIHGSVSGYLVTGAPLLTPVCRLPVAPDYLLASYYSCLPTCLLLLLPVYVLLFACLQKTHYLLTFTNCHIYVLHRAHVPWRRITLHYSDMAMEPPPFMVTSGVLGATDQTCLKTTTSAMVLTNSDANNTSTMASVTACSSPPARTPSKNSQSTVSSRTSAPWTTRYNQGHGRCDGGVQCRYFSGP
ncbi:hypothetical protein EJ02DRAFT_245523 [Clathrospora elynae]|uniref:Uncharacterized protein n=1 Tax=Clathrospora elynae TaxID=706981 RepID=A0A6A5SGN8_9PLEO|nr:hypothetical protein EJ02DRAFT_245523 [Clathrospora elynae]